MSRETPLWIVYHDHMTYYLYLTTDVGRKESPLPEVFLSHVLSRVK
jgi:hypothetical protein